MGVEVEDRFVANHLQGKTARGRDPFGREMSNPSVNPEGEDYSTFREGGFASFLVGGDERGRTPAVATALGKPAEIIDYIPW
jgi:hypothetical protein